MAFWWYVWKLIKTDVFWLVWGSDRSRLSIRITSWTPWLLSLGVWNAVRAIVIDFYWKIDELLDLDGFPGCLGQGVGATCGALWQPVAADGIGVLPLIISFDRRIEAWKLQSSRPGLMSWLVDLDGLDWLADWLIWIGMIERSDWHLTRSTLQGGRRIKNVIKML